MDRVSIEDRRTRVRREFIRHGARLAPEGAVRCDPSADGTWHGVGPFAAAAALDHVRGGGSAVVGRAGIALDANDAAGNALALSSTGSTGEPTQVWLDPEAFAWRVARFAELMSLAADDGVLIFASLAGSFGFTTFCAAASAARRVAYCDPTRPDEAASALAELRPDVVVATPSVFRLIARFGPVAAAGSVRLGVCGAEAVSGAELARWEAGYGCGFRRTYGSAETGVALTGVGDGPLFPVEGVQAEVGDSGTLRLRTPGLARLPRDPAAPGWFATRDLAAAEDGGFRILGRADDVIRRGGISISPYPAERIACGEPEVDSAHLVPAGSAAGHPVIVLVLGLAPEPPDTPALRTAVKRRVLSALRRMVGPEQLPDLVVFGADLAVEMIGDKTSRRALRAAVDTHVRQGAAAG